MEKSWVIAERIWSMELPTTEKLVALCVLKHRNNDTGKCYPSRKRLAAMCGISVRAVSRALESLKASGVISDDGYRGCFKLLSFPIVQSRVLGDTSVTPPVSSASPQDSIFRPGVGEDMGEYDERCK